MDLEAFNALPEDEARRRLATCLDVPRWVDTVIEGRPYADEGAMTAVATNAGDLDDAELDSALARHPRIGERVSLRDGSSLASSGQATGTTSERSHDAEHSEREQAGVDSADADIARRLADGNRAYEGRFDRVFLIRAEGRDATEILAELERRLGSDDETERAETVAQLREIALLRLEQVV